MTRERIVGVVLGGVLLTVSYANLRLSGAEISLTFLAGILSAYIAGMITGGMIAR